MAEIGRIGGSARGDCKRRPREHYVKMVQARIAKKKAAEKVSC